LALWSVRLPCSVPYVFCADVGTVADWSVAVLGFTERHRWTDEDGAVNDVELIERRTDRR